jgi:phage protein U
MQVAILGSVIFKVSNREVMTLNNFTRSRTARYAKHDVLVGKSKLEFKGMDLDTITFDVRLDSSLGVDVQKELDKFSDMAENGLAGRLIVGDKSYGYFVITNFDENVKRTHINGNSTVVEVPITLQEYA